MKNFLSARQPGPYMPPGEIELIDLIILVILIIQKYIRTIVGLIAVGMIIGFGTYLKQTKEYKSTLFFKIPALSSQDIMHIFESIDNHIRKGDTEILVSEWGLKPHTTAQLRKVRLIATDESGAYRIETIGITKDYPSALAVQLSELLTGRNAAASQDLKSELNQKIQLLSSEIKNIDGLLKLRESRVIHQQTPEDTDGLLKLKLELLRECLDLELKKEKIGRGIYVSHSQRHATVLERTPNVHLIIGITVGFLASLLVIACKELKLVIAKRRQPVPNHRVDIPRKFNYN